MLTSVDLEVVYSNLLELRNRLSIDGSNEIFDDDHLLLDWVLDTFEFIFENKELTKDLEEHLKELYNF